MENRWFSWLAVVVVGVLVSVAADAGPSNVLDLSNGGYKTDVLRKSELLKSGDASQWGEINLCGNSIDEVDDNTFVGFSNLKQLNLSSNSLATIEEHWFKGSKLTSLDLSKNVLVAIRSDAFSGLADLKELNLASNYLRPFKPNTFNHTPKLIKLDMQNNSRVQDMFLNVTIPSLEELNLQKCRIENIATLHLNNIPNLKKIDLRGNTVHELDGGFVANSKLKEVDLRDNFLDSLRGDAIKKTFSPGSKLVVHFDLNSDICTDCKIHSCTNDLELQTFLCQNPNNSSLRDVFEWADQETNTAVTFKAHAPKTE